MFKMSTIGTNTSIQACWSLVNCIISRRPVTQGSRIRPPIITAIAFVSVEPL